MPLACAVPVRVIVPSIGLVIRARIGAGTRRRIQGDDRLVLRADPISHQSPLKGRQLGTFVLMMASWHRRKAGAIEAFMAGV